MFRALQNPFDGAIAKATDENLTSENWEYIMDVCDKVTNEDSGAKDAVASMIKRLAHRNANVQLYTLELANALSQNCGPRMHRELASRAFTDALLRLANDRNTHQQVKTKILERMQEWADIFTDPDLGIMKDQYNRLKSMNPNLHPPSAPSKSRLTDLDRQKEEEELQIALKLSIQDKGTASQAKTGQPSGTTAGSAPPQQANQNQTLSSGTTAATVSRVRALFDFQATDPDELTFRKGDIIAVLESVYKDWWKGLLRGQTGIFPLNYVEKLADPTPEELQRESQMEAEVFAEIKNVEKLLTLLSTSASELNVRDNEEITKLYHSTLSIRPKLIELIGKYSQRKDDFTQLNERFIKSCRDYESLLDASMTQAQSVYQYGRPPVHGYGGYAQGPPQQDPYRYYTPASQQQDIQRPRQPSSPPPHNPQRPGNAPYYIAGQPGGAPAQPYPDNRQSYAPSLTPRIPSSGAPQGPVLLQATPPPSNFVNHSAPPPQPTPQTGHRPSSTYSNPQELATSAYDSPVGQHPQSGPYKGPYHQSAHEESYPLTNGPPTPQPPAPPQAHEQGPIPPQQAYKPYTPYSQRSQGPPQNQQQPSYDAPPAPGQAATPVPSALSPGYPLLDGRQSLPSQMQAAGSYQPAGAHESRDYYRVEGSY